jgi:hypothetical protein
VDNVCFMPSFQPGDVIETIREARENVTSERAGREQAGADFRRNRTDSP